MNEDLFDLEGKVAIVTGASQGLGKAISIGLSKKGAKVVAADIKDTSETIQEIKRNKGESIGIKVDISDKSDVESMVNKTMDEYGKIDILVNNAGILRMEDAETMSKEDWDKVINVNLTGQFLCAQAVGTQMIQQKNGKIINISSIAGLSGYANSAVYSASKGGVLLMTKTLAVEWAEYNINVNSICPGVFETGMTGDLLEDEDFKKMIKENVPLGRHAEPKELVGTVIFLSSKASDYMTGSSIVIDGGWTAGL